MQSNKTIILTAVLLILTILTAGCISRDSVQTYQQADVPKEVIDTQPAQVVPIEVVPEPVVEVAPVEVETHWYDSKPTFNPGIIEANDNLFNQDIEGIINEGARANGGIYDVFDENQNLIFQHHEYGAADLNLERELPIDQYRALVAEYGAPSLVTMETIDNDPAHAGMDEVAVKYVGSKGVLEFETSFWDSGASLSNYIARYLIKGI